MNQLAEMVKEKSEPLLLLPIGISPPAIALWLHESLIAYLASLTPTQLLWLLVPLLCISTVSLAYSLYLKPWFSWDEPTGTWVNNNLFFNFS